MDNKDIFLNSITRLIKHLLIDNQNYSNSYFYNESYTKYDLRKDIKERANVILENIESSKHLLDNE